VIANFRRQQKYGIHLLLSEDGYSDPSLALSIGEFDDATAAKAAVQGLLRPVAAPITDFDSAKRYIEGLVYAGLNFHLGGDPSEVVHSETGRRVFTDEETPILRERVRQLHSFNWGEYECAIGYMLHAINMRTLDKEIDDFDRDFESRGIPRTDEDQRSFLLDAIAGKPAELKIAHDMLDHWEARLGVNVNRLRTLLCDTSESRLSTQLSRFCDREGLPYTDADEIISTPGINATQREWLANFIARWNSEVVEHREP
jgi:hypothetical protein